MSTLSDRLREARNKAGFTSISQVIQHFGWPYSTYAGHENGHRGAKLPDVEKYATAFNVTANWLLTGSDGKPTDVKYNISKSANPTGFNEGPVAPFYPASDTIRRKLIDLARAVDPAANQPSFYELTRHHPTLMLMRGDVLVVDQKRLIATEGGIIVSQQVNEQTGEGQTLLRIQKDGKLHPPFGDTAPTKDEIEAAIGSVVCMFRPPMSPWTPPP